MGTPYSTLAGDYNPTRLPYVPVTAQSVTPDQIVTNDATAYTPYTADNYSTDYSVQPQGFPAGGYSPQPTDPTAPPDTSAPPAPVSQLPPPSGPYYPTPTPEPEPGYPTEGEPSQPQPTPAPPSQPWTSLETAGWNYGAAPTTDTAEFRWAQIIKDPALGGTVGGPNNGFVSGIDLQTAINRYNAIYGPQGVPAAKIVGADKVDFGDGRGAIDVVRDVGGPNQALWYDTSGGGGAGGGGGGGGGGLGDITDAIKKIIQGVGGGGGAASGPGYFGTNPWWNPTPVDPNGSFSTSLDNAILDMIRTGGAGQFGQYVQDQLKNMIATGGIDQPAINNRLINARESEANAFNAQMADARSRLADAGLISQPGSPQGAEAQTIQNVSDALAPSYAAAVRDIQSAALDRANQNIVTALGQAANLSVQDAQNLLAAVGKGTDRQQMFANIALEQLNQNRQWNQFLMQNGLDRDRLTWEVSQGNTQLMINLIHEWILAAQVSAGGYY